MNEVKRYVSQNNFILQEFEEVWDKMKEPLPQEDWKKGYDLIYNHNLFCL